MPRWPEKQKKKYVCWFAMPHTGEVWHWEKVNAEDELEAVAFGSYKAGLWPYPTGLCGAELEE